MKVIIKIGQPETRIIDLESFGHPKHFKWEDLEESEQIEIIDSLREQYVPVLIEAKNK